MFSQHPHDKSENCCNAESIQSCVVGFLIAALTFRSIWGVLSMGKISILCGVFAVSLAFYLSAPPSFAQTSDDNQPILSAGDAVVTRFSGVTTAARDPQLPPIPLLDHTYIDLDGIATRITPLTSPGYLWDARVWPASPYLDFKARDIGQVFGVTIDDEQYPSIYVTASSVYGLHIVGGDTNGDALPDRLRNGSTDARWMDGQWGQKDPKGGPGSIWKIDGKTGDVSLFATVQLGTETNPGPGLGNITFDKAHRQLFVSDLATGMIHRFGLDGVERSVFDPGFMGMEMAQRPSTTYDPDGRLDITKGDFDSQDPETWGYTDENRRVWGLAVHKDRLYYAMVGQSAIFSVGLDEKTGDTLQDARWELDVPKKPKKLPVTDIVFTSQGAMTLAQRGAIESTQDYTNFADPGKARVYRYWLENPDNPETPSRWIAEPEEHAIGFEPEHRATDGGLALGHGYTREGYINTFACEASLWTTGDNLRRNDPLKDRLLPAGAQMIDGLQGMPPQPVKQYPPEKNNTPPWVSYMLDVNPDDTDDAAVFVPEEPIWNDTTTQGWMGDIAILRRCDGAVADGSGGGGGGYGGWPEEWPWYVVDPPHCLPGQDCDKDKDCKARGDCDPPPSCAKLTGEFTCDTATGTWTYKGKVATISGFNADAIKVSNVPAGQGVTGAPMLSYTSPGSTIQLTGGAPGQVMGADLCFFNKADMASGKPFACCKTSIDIQAPTKACEKKP